MDRSGASRLVHFTTDMIYGHSVVTPQTEDHPAALRSATTDRASSMTETLAAHYRGNGFRISIFRPRLIIGPGRLGILEKLFKLIDLNLPVPMIGSGSNPYQFISVFDCASAPPSSPGRRACRTKRTISAPILRRRFAKLLGRPDPAGRLEVDPAADAGARW